MAEISGPGGVRVPANTPETRVFELGDLLSIVPGLLVSGRHVDGVYDLLGFMTGDSLYTHQLPRASRACEPELLRQHPWLARIEAPEWKLPRDDREAEVFAWVRAMEMTHGKFHKVIGQCPGWRSMDPVAELDQLAGTRPVIVAHVDPWAAADV